MSAVHSLPASTWAGDEAAQRRLRITLIISLVIHALIVLGVGFSVSSNAPLVPTLEVIFSQTSTELTPEQADFLAQANQIGGGDHDLALRPRDNQAGVTPHTQDGLTPIPLQAQAAITQPPSQMRVISRTGENADIPRAQTRPEPEQPQSTAPLTARERRDAEMARLAAEIHQHSQHYARRPHRKFISASTREYAYANYMRGWVDRAERVGNLNYPDEARRRRLSGQVVISVGIRPDGSVESSRIVRSSGTPLLDDTALRVVELAQPFPALPRTDEDVDILHITRTWVFLPGGRLLDER